MTVKMQSQTRSDGWWADFEKSLQPRHNQLKEFVCLHIGSYKK